MKLLRYGAPGHEKPGVLDSNGIIRDLSGIVQDIAGEVLLSESIARLNELNLSSLPQIDSNVRLGPCVGRVGKFICIGLNYADHAAESGSPVPREPVLFMKATSAICGPNDDVAVPRIDKNRLGSRTRRDHRQAGEICRRERCAVPCCGILRGERSLGTRISTRKYGPMGEGEERRHIWTDRTMVRHRR